MRASVIHLDLNPCGGAEQLSLATMQALLGMGIQVDLHVAREPDIPRLEMAFGRERIRPIFEQVQVRLLGRLPVDLDKKTGALTCSQKAGMEGYGLVINTHADILPYFLPSFSRRTCISYCHFPVVADYAVQQDMEYLKVFANHGLVDEEIIEAAVAASKTEFWRSFLDYYLLMLRNSHVVTNSNFSRQAIVRWMKGEPALPFVIPPPVSVEEFRSAALPAAGSRRDGTVLVVSRINRSKKLENALALARILKRQGIGSRMVIAGNLSPDDRFGCAYYLQLQNMIAQYGLSDYVTIMLNVELERLKSLMRSSSVYFHPLAEEPFGISVVEAMSAGLMPVVPDIGGPTEFVPRQYQYGSIEEAAGIVRYALAATGAERAQISDSVRSFSSAAYIRRFQEFVRDKMMAAMAQPATSRADGGAQALGASRHAKITHIERE
ncbi:MAG: glycosyltransferase [Nitrososphaera sp.]|jgi:glycosyltransferase involved in cell wall biosynthesis